MTLVARAGATALALEPDGEVVEEAPLEPPITIGLSLAKHERTEWAVAKLTELGVDTIVPLLCDRTATRPDGRRQNRLSRIVRESAMQSRRARLPEVTEPVGFPEFLAARAGGRSAIGLAEPGGAALSLRTPTILVGPEGGWSPRELELARAESLPAVGLAPTVLRIETAAVAAASILVAARIGLL